MTTEASDPHPRLAALQAAAANRGRMPVAVAYPCSNDALAAALAARDAGLIEPILVGPRERIAACAAATASSLEDVRVIDTPDDRNTASHAAVTLAASGEAGAIMKGSQHTDELLAAVVSRDAGLRTSRRISHVFWFDLPAYHKPLLVTDAVVNIVPTLAEKSDILRNAIDLARRLGIARPKVALLSAVETINPALPSTLDAAALCKMVDRGQIENAVVDGPLALDNAISAEAARTKGIVSEVAGDPDVLLVPNLESGNILYKALTYLGGGECAGLILGARVPIILTSRADSRRAREASCALGRLAVA